MKLKKHLPPRGKESILQEAHRLVSGDRHNEHGSLRRTFPAIADACNAIRQVNPDTVSLTAVDIVVVNIVTKLVRLQTSYSRDNWVDIAGYAQIGAAILDDEELPDA